MGNLIVSSNTKIMRKAKTIALWVLKILTGFGFSVASLAKLTSNPQMIQNFENWGYPSWFYLVIGILELAGAILLFVPKMTLYAVIGLAIIMIGAVVTHLIHDSIHDILGPVIYLVLLSGIAYLNN